MASLFRFLTFRGHWGRLGCVLLLPLLHSLHHLHHGAGFYHGFRSRNGKNRTLVHRETAQRVKVKVLNRKGVANQTGPESSRALYVAPCEMLDEALTRRPATEPLKRCPNHCSVQNLELTVRFFPFREVKRSRKKKGWIVAGNGTVIQRASAPSSFLASWRPWTLEG
jgi:hypothetical protein